MPRYDWIVLMGVGGFFILLGVGAFIWGLREEKGYYNAVSNRFDVREFLEHLPHYPQFWSLKMGGWISIAVGVVLIALGIAFRLRG